MTTAHLERQFEDEVVAHLTNHGWHPGDRTSYRRELGIDTGELLTFLGATQPEKWERLISLHGSADRAQQRFAKRLADELTSRGTIDVLRRGVTDLGVHVDLLYAEPAHELTPELRRLFDANRCTVVRQLGHSESNLAVDASSVETTTELVASPFSAGADAVHRPDAQASCLRPYR